MRALTWQERFEELQHHALITACVLESADRVRQDGFLADAGELDEPEGIITIRLSHTAASELAADLLKAARVEAALGWKERIQLSLRQWRRRLGHAEIPEAGEMS